MMLLLVSFYHRQLGKTEKSNSVRAIELLTVMFDNTTNSLLNADVLAKCSWIIWIIYWYYLNHCWTFYIEKILITILKIICVKKNVMRNYFTYIT